MHQHLVQMTLLCSKGHYFNTQDKARILPEHMHHSAYMAPL